jgi:hypothetical protein
MHGRASQGGERELNQAGPRRRAGLVRQAALNGLREDKPAARLKLKSRRLQRLRRFKARQQAQGGLTSAEPAR